MLVVFMFSNIGSLTSQKKFILVKFLVVTIYHITARLETIKLIQEVCKVLLSLLAYMEEELATCAVCSRDLTRHDSIDRGIGPMMRKIGDYIMIISKAPFGKYCIAKKVDLGNENFQKVVWTSWIQKMVRQRDDVRSNRCEH